MDRDVVEQPFKFSKSKLQMYRRNALTKELFRARHVSDKYFNREKLATTVWFYTYLKLTDLSCSPREPRLFIGLLF